MPERQYASKMFKAAWKCRTGTSKIKLLEDAAFKMQSQVNIEGMNHDLYRSEGRDATMATSSIEK